MPVASIVFVSAWTTLVDETSFRSQMMLLAGFVVLIWVLMRRTIRAKKRGRIEAEEWRQQQQQTASASHASLPLANAPVDVLRWQGAMFDLQRELKAELETKISVIQAMVQLADQRIATLQGLASSDADQRDADQRGDDQRGDDQRGDEPGAVGTTSGAAAVLQPSGRSAIAAEIQRMSLAGIPLSEIAASLHVPLAEVAAALNLEP